MKGRIQRSAIRRGLLLGAAALIVALGLSTQFATPAAADDNWDWQRHHGNWHGNGYWRGGVWIEL